MPVTMPGRRWVALVAIIALAGLTRGGSSVAGGGTASGGSARPARPAALLDSALSALLASRSVRLSGTASGPAGQRANVSGDLGPGSGRQVVTGSSGARATVLEVDGAGYLKANRVALAGHSGFSQAMVRQLAGRWILFRSGESGGGVSYQDVIKGMTLGSLADELDLTGPLALTAPTVVAGTAVIGVRGDAAAALNAPSGTTETLYVAASGPPLPVSLRITLPGSFGESCTFSHWGEPLRVTAPRKSFPITSVSGLRQ